MSDTVYEGVAIIGLAGRFPGADSVEEFWNNLAAGKETVSFFSDEELSAAGHNVAELKRRGQYIAARGVLKHADCFDAAFFGIHPKEAEVMDPQQRVFLEACWEALERAGYGPGRIQGSVGVFAGATFNTYFQHVLYSRPDLIELVGSDLVMFGNEKDYLTTRVAYKLGLKGPALNVSTACSTSLVSVCQACQSLLTYQCDMALAGGVSVRVPQQSGYYYDEGNIGSSDGHTRSFDHRAAGTVFSNGVGVVALKRLEDAVKDGDQIYAVIKGAALNNDGSHRVSFGAPGVEGQSEVIAMAHAIAGVDPETITYVEAHGTATPLGDPIEVAGLTKAFRIGTDAKQFCGLGSVKTNIGHLDAAAGVTGLIKTALALHHKAIPASLHFTGPNPKLDLENSPFYVNSEFQEWKTKPGVPRRAGVSSFGTGGTNAHVVLEEAPVLEASGSSRPWQLLPLSTKTAAALDTLTTGLSAHLQQMAGHADADGASRELADAAFTLQTGRSEFTHRRIIVCADAAEGAAALDARDPKRVFTQQQQLADPPVVFMFPGQGAQFAGMGAELYRSEPVFRAEVDRCAELLWPLIGTDLRTLMYPAEDAKKEADELLVQTRFTQPALFVTEYALAKLWMSWGVRPAAMIGHSVGEYAAACLAGVFTLEDALSLVARRAQLVQAQPGGAMLAVRLPEAEVLPLLNGRLSVAAINSPALCVVAGPHEEIAALEEELASRGAAARHLHTSHAFHSSMMDPVLAPFTELLRKVKFNEPRIPFVSNTTARWITPEQAQSPEYWAGHVRQTVRFADGVAELLKDARNVLLEVGPGQTLSTLARQHPSRPAEQTVLASLPYADVREPRGLMESLGRLWMAGVTVDWQAFYANERRRRAVVPTYPFERKRYWPESSPVSAAPVVQTVNVAPALPPAEVQPLPAATDVSAPPVETQPAVPRKERLLAASRALLQELSGYDFSDVDPTVSLMEMGLDSLLLTQASQLFNRKFGVPITFRQLMEELESLDAIAAHLDAALPPEAVARAVASPVSVPVRAAAAAGAVSAAPATPLFANPDGKSHGPFKPIQRGADLALTREQSEALQSWIARYTRRTAGSKKLAAQNRAVLADPRSVSGFKQLWKEMVYQISTVRSDGSRVWDVDGNEYIDFVMGFGASLFGHRPPFVVQAVHEQLDLGFEIGPIQPLAGEVAALVREFTGMQRVGFTNTGSEAVLAATRVARTVTGRDKIAVFAGAYHGIFDEVLFRPLTINGETRTAAISPGIPESALGQVIVLDYGNPQSLEILRARGAEIAAVLVEPVQSRRLDLQPKEFMHELRRITQESGSALIFDEVVTGFRVHPGGAQAYFGVRADLATYGKVIGGGLPIGLVAGDPKFMDTLDGGQWQYGDTSFPEVGVTFFAGTFVRHPLALAAAKAVLMHLKQSGPELQQRLAERAERLADDLRALCGEFGAAYPITQFSSLIQVGLPPEQKFAGLLFYLLRDRGIHIYENRAFVMTTAHSEEDVACLLRAFRECFAEMQAGGFLPPPQSPLRAEPMLRREPAAIPAPVSVSGRIPLTEAQREIWLAAQMGGDAALGYNESLKLELRGLLDVELFRKAVRQVVERYPILLATFSDDGQWQQIGSSGQIDVPLFDFSTRSEPDSELQSLIDREVSEPFALAKGPLVRINIARLSENHHAVIWTAHHIVCDGWSAGLLINELARVYSALKQGTQPVLEAPIAFQEYVRTVSEDTPAAQKALEYWQRQFADLPQPLDLPTDRPRPAVRSAQASTLKRDMSSELHQSLKQIAGKQRTTLVVLLMAGLKTLLHRLTGQADVVVGLGVAGQAMTGQTALVGHCVNLMPIRTRLQTDAGFQENLAAVKKVVLDAYDHYQSTLGSILQHLRVPRSQSRPPLVEVIFNVDKDPGAAQFAGLEVSCDRNPKRALHFDLFFNFVEGPRGLYVECDYNTDLFDASTIERWLKHYQTLLEGVAANTGEALGKLPILTPRESRELTVEWNQTGVQFPKQRTLHEWFENQVSKTPDARALTCEGRHWTYDELNRRANQVAHYLKGRGVGPDVLVGLFLERSPEIAIGILGILKAGGAYLPIDPVYPSDRLAFMIEDAGVPVLLTNSALARELPTLSAEVVCFDTDKVLFDREPESNPHAAAAPDNLAYVIYTSGSTGQPKGTRVTHFNVVRLMQATESWYRFNERDVWTFFHSQAFDFSVWELWGALLYGGRLVMVPYATSRSPRDFYLLLASEGVTVLNQTPSAFRQLIEAEAGPGGAHDLALRYVIFGGEALEMGSLQPWFDRHGDQKPLLVNMYGITETTVHVTYRPLSIADLSSGSVIGVPIPDLQVYILDQQQQPVPIGVRGEIYVGGDGVAAGYLNRNELTAQRFLPDPFTGRPGALLYRSGDLGRFLPNRDIEYFGRIDNQVKIRGFRIETGEIEAVLGRHQTVRQCLVMAREDTPGDKTLAAYLELQADSELDFADLRAHLKKHLPDYMIPSAFVSMGHFPLTPNGKIDRKALPAPSYENRQTANQFVAPRTETEKALATIWAQMLKVDRIGLNDNFFNLGGHSLLVVRAASQIRDVFEVDLPPRAFFANPTIAGLAKAVGEAQSGAAAVQRIGRRNQSGPAPLSFAQERIWFLDRLASGSPAYNIVDVVRFDGGVQPEALSQAIRELVRRHEILRTAFVITDGQPMQVILPTIEVPFRVLDLSALSEREQEPAWTRAVREDGRKPFDLDQPPLLRCTLVRRREEHLLLLTIHHIIADEWSMEVLQKELREIYQAIYQGGTLALPELPIQYSDFALWQRDWLQGDVLRKQLSYWKEELAGIPAALELSTDRPRPPEQSFRGATKLLEVPMAVLQRLKSIGSEEQATLFMTLLAGFMALMHRYTGQDDVLVGTPISGRTRSETESLIGFFLNTVVLRAQFSFGLSFRSLLKQVRERALGAYGHQDLPFERIVAEVAPDRDPSHSPLFQVMFILSDSEAVSRTSSVAGIRELETGTSKFDLTLYMSETENGLTGLIEYSTDLFEPETIQRMGEHLGTLLQSMSVDPDKSIGNLPMLPAAEQQRLLSDWNNTTVEFRQNDRCLHEVFEQQCSRNPDRVAVALGEQRLTYGELNRRSNQLARHLRELGVGPGALVGLCVERSLEMVVGLFGILKAGGAYVPLDPSFPKDRLAYMVQDSGMRALVTQDALYEQLLVRPASVVRLDSDGGKIAAHSSEDLKLPETNPANPAYVLYTSGSTGKPKGVEIPHSALVNFLFSMQREPGFTPADTLLAVTTLSFDIAGLELYLPLISGGIVEIASREDALDPARLMERIRDSACTVMQATPATWSALIHAGWSGSPNLKALCGGEALPADLARELLRRCRELWNMYGPTETTIWSTIHRVTSADGVIPIGRPIANTRIFVLDGYRSLVPTGTVGELYIGGAGLAHGYLDRPTLTRDRFVENPFTPGERLYRTGDLARWLPDGTVECLGRVDNQVKIRGFRIELGEVEAVLAGQDDVKQCVVVVREDVPGEKRLVAYFELQAARAPVVSDLRSRLKKQLPDYMLPAAFVAMEKLPLTPNGKIDRKALPAPDNNKLETNQGFVEPRDDIEARLVSVWQEVLHVQNIGVRDNFFDAGGYSLLAVRLFSEIKKVFGVTLPLSTLFRSPTIEHLAQCLREDHRLAFASSLVPVQPDGNRPPLYCVAGLDGGVMVFHKIATHLGPDQPVFGLEPPGMQGDKPVLLHVEDIAAHYVRELVEAQPNGPYHLAGYSFGGLVAFEMAIQLCRQGHQVGILALLDAENWQLAKQAPTKTRWGMTAAIYRVHLRQIVCGPDRWEFLRNKIGHRLLRLLYWYADKTNRPPSEQNRNIYDIQAFAGLTYRPGVYKGRLDLFRAEVQLSHEIADPLRGWGGLVDGEIVVHEIPGDHLSMNTGENLGILGAGLRGCLEQAGFDGRTQTSQPARIVDSTLTEVETQ